MIIKSRERKKRETEMRKKNQRKRTTASRQKKRWAWFAPEAKKEREKERKKTLVQFSQTYILCIYSYNMRRRRKTLRHGYFKNIHYTKTLLLAIPFFTHVEIINKNIKGFHHKNLEWKWFRYYDYYFLPIESVGRFQTL